MFNAKNGVLISYHKDPHYECTWLCIKSDHCCSHKNHTCFYKTWIMSSLIVYEKNTLAKATVTLMIAQDNFLKQSLFHKTAVHGDVIKWKHFPHYWPFVRGIHRSPVNSTHKGQWHGALIFYLICARINGWVNNREAGDLRRHRAHYDVIVMGYYHVESVEYVYTHWSDVTLASCCLKSPATRQLV